MDSTGAFIAIAIWVLIVWVTAKIAASKGYGVVLAIIMAVLFGIFALIVYALLPGKKEKRVSAPLWP